VWWRCCQTNRLEHQLSDRYAISNYWIHTYCAVLFVLVCQHRSKSIPPKPNCLVANVYPALVQEVFHISELTWEPDKHHYRTADNFRAYLKVMKGAALCHRQTLKRGPFSLKFVLIWYCQNRDATAAQAYFKIYINFEPLHDTS